MRQFFRRSRAWSKAVEGLDLLQIAGEDLKAVAGVDSGFFVYRRRLTEVPGRTDKYRVYAPWGVFAEHADTLPSVLEHGLKDRIRWLPFIERWTLFEDLPLSAQDPWRQYGVLELGVWPIVSYGRTCGAIIAGRTHSDSSLTLETSTALLDACAAHVSLALDLIFATQLAEEASQRDLLTGLLNRRGLEANLPSLIRSAATAGNHVVLGLLDVDDLKIINDTLGHPLGDQTLRQIADIIANNVRSNDIVARLGGDEFAVVLQTDVADADAPMERIRAAVEQQSTGSSVSVGGAVWGVDGHAFEECYRVADHRLYRCKRLTKTGEAEINRTGSPSFSP